MSEIDELFGIKQYERACDLVIQKNYELAIRCFQTAIMNNTQIIDSYRNIAKCQSKLKLFQDAIKTQEKIVELEPTDWIAYNNLGNIYYKISNYEKAIEYYNKALKTSNSLDLVKSNKIRAINKAIEELSTADDFLSDDYDFDKSMKKFELEVELKLLIKEEKPQKNISKLLERIEEMFDVTDTVHLDTCSREDLLNFDCFDEEKANRFIKARNNGKKYYDINSFAQDFELQPHEIIEIQDYLVFPLKPNIKHGRKVEW